MSNRERRPELTGVIMQGSRPVGAVVLPDPPCRFIEQFDAAYRHLGLSVRVVERPENPELRFERHANSGDNNLLKKAG